MKNKMVIVCQRDVKDCGACCLQSIIKFYNGYVPIEKIRLDTYTSMQGVSVYHLLKAAEKYGFDAIAKKIEDKNLNNIILPAIVHVKYDNGLTHFMCLYEIKGSNYILMDPSKGKIKMTKEEFNKIFAGVVLQFTPKDKIILLEKENSIYNLFIKILIKNKKLCINALLCSFLLTIITIISGMYFKVMNEFISNNAFQNTIKILIFIFLLCIVFKIIFDYLKKYYENHINKNIDVSVFKEFINHLFHLPLNVIESRSSGEIMSRVNEISSIKELFSQIFIFAFLDLMICLASFIVLLNINIKITFILIIFVLIYIIISILISPYLYKRIRQNIEYQTEVNTILLENIDMINSIKNLNETENILNKIENKICNLIFDNYSFNISINFFETLKNIFYELSFFIINTYGFYLIYNNKFSLISLVIYNTFLSYFMSPIKNIVSLIPKYNFLRASFNKICDFINIKEEKIGESKELINGDIIIENISFSYDNYNYIIKDFSEVVKANEKIMIKGKSGSGKSSLCKLLTRDFSLNNGCIYINGININDYSLNTIKDNIIYVGQKENLYTDTIKNNILFNYEDESNFNKVCKICLIDLIVNKRKLRYDFGISNDSINISGGEKQRIILARALLRNSKILILDEALSETDYFMEKTIIKNIIREYPEKTIIYVSHKKQDNLFDRVITLKGEHEK
ncbi:MAG: cysteine peptidase family C39 domain-containing protein [bacterium]|nr:cysteine peptidase family C39 domain-containing protein [bacterium]